MEDVISKVTNRINIPSMYRPSLEKHLQFQFNFLSNATSFISLFIFRAFFSYPSALSRKLFRAMNRSKDEKLTIKEFIDGFMTIYFGSIEERAHFLFALLSYDNKTINLNDIKIMLMNLMLHWKKESMFTAVEKLISKIELDSDTFFDENSFIEYLLKR